jgi:hypothetical protein
VVDIIKRRVYIGLTDPILAGSRLRPATSSRPTFLENFPLAAGGIIRILNSYPAFTLSLALFNSHDQHEVSSLNVQKSCHCHNMKIKSFVVLPIAISFIIMAFLA